MSSSWRGDLTIISLGLKDYNVIENDVDFPLLYFHNNLEYSASVSRTETRQEIKLTSSKHFNQSD